MTEVVHGLPVGPSTVVVLGAGGMLGQAVVQRFRESGQEVVPADRRACDVTSLEQCRAFIGKRPGAIVINCAAYTNVNLAESEKDAAFAVNAAGAENVARACVEGGARLCVYVSTDYVFGGNLGRPYEPDDATGPLNAYGASKLAGERAVLRAGGASLVVRTSWLYGEGGRNFVSTMLEAAAAGRDLRVIDDQVGSPTYAGDLAEALVRLTGSGSTGIVHATNSGSCTWYGFAAAIFEESGIAPASLVAVSSGEFVTAARRPADSRLSGASLVAAVGAEMPRWRDGLRRFLAGRLVRAHE